MGLFYLFIIAAVQGITEFLPISSSAHLVLLPHITGQADQGLVMDVAAHVGTLFAVLVFFRRDIFNITAAMTWRYRHTNPVVKHDRRIGKMVVLATMPIIIGGAILHAYLPEGIRDIRVIMVTTIVFGLLLGWADYKFTTTRDIKTMTVKGAFFIGCMQVIALLPGTSRSGITMTAARMLGFSRTDSARFSLLLSIPAICGAGVLATLDIVESGRIVLGIDAVIVALLSFITAWVAITLMMRWLKTSSFTPFVIYRMILGSVLLYYIMV